MQVPGHERYACGLPWLARGELSAADAAWLRGRLRGLWVGSIVGGLALGLAGAVAVSVTLRWPDPAHALGGAPGVWLSLVGAIGTVAALVAGQRAWRILAALGVLYLAGLAAVGALLPGISGSADPITRTILAATVALGDAFVLLAIVRRTALLLRTPAIARDLQGAAVDRYAGRVTEPSPELRRIGVQASAAGQSADTCLEVLPRSGVVVRVDGQAPRRWSRAHLAEVAPVQPHALRVGLPRGVVPGRASASLQLRRRSLTEPERAELSRHIGRLRRRPWSAIAATAAAVGLAALRLGADPTPAALLEPVLLGWVALAGVTVVAYARRLSAARRLEHDRRLRWVVTVEDPEPTAAMGPPRLEVLPMSQLAWTENAAVASWRTSRW